MENSKTAEKTNKNLQYLFRNLVEDPYIFVKFYFILLLIQSLFFVAPNIQASLNKVFIVWGTLIIAYHLIVKRTFFKDKISLVFMASSFLALITIMLNREAGALVYSLKTWYLLNFAFMIFYSFFQMSSKSKEDILRGMFKPIIFLQFVFALVSLVMFYGNIVGFIQRVDEGFYWGLRYVFRSSGAINPLLPGVYNDSNYASIITFSSIVFSFITLKQPGIKPLIKKFLWLNIVVQLYFFILANSRAALLGILIFVFILALLQLREFLILKKFTIRSKEKVILLVLIIFALFFGNAIRSASYNLTLNKPITRITIVLPGADTQIYPHWEQDSQEFSVLKLTGEIDDDFVGIYTNYFKPEDYYVFSEEREKETYENKFNLSSSKEDSLDTFEGKGNGRIGRWLESLRLVTRHRPLTGTSPRGIKYFAEKYSSENEEFWRLKAGYATVNSYITYLLYYGWPAFLIFMLFFLGGGIVILRTTLSKRHIATDEMFMLAFLAFMLAQAFFLSALLEVLTYYSSVLAFTYGFCVNAFRSEVELK